MTEQPSCLCVREGHPGRQDVGHYDNGVYVKTGDSYEVISYGPDKSQGGADDISSNAKDMNK